MPRVTISKRAYPHRAGYRYRLSAGQGRVKWAPVGATEQEARELAELTIAGYQQEIGVLVSDLRDGYLEHLKANDRKPISVRTCNYNLTLLVGPLLDLEAASVTVARARVRYRDLVPTRAAATHQAALGRAKECWKWAVKRGMVRSNPWAEVEPIGRAKRGKAKLTLDETNRLIDECLTDADTSDAALAILVCVFCGVRSSEILKRQVRDVDAGGTRLNIPETKSEAGKRAPAIPEVIQAAVQLRCKGRAGDAPLIRNVLGASPVGAWLWKALHVYCKRAGVPVVCPHALRGGWADIAYSAGELSRIESPRRSATVHRPSQSGTMSGRMLWRTRSRHGVWRGSKQRNSVPGLSPLISPVWRSSRPLSPLRSLEKHLVCSYSV